MTYEIEETSHKCKTCGEEFTNPISCYVHAVEKEHSGFEIMGSDVEIFVGVNGKSKESRDNMRGSTNYVMMCTGRMI